MNWGYKILFVYLAFVAGIMYMVYKTTLQKEDLVANDYYSKELKYQQTINAARRFDSLSEPIRYVIKDNQFIVQFPKVFEGKNLSGKVVLYCPSDENKDVSHEFNIKDTTISIPFSPSAITNYEIHLSWKADGKEYYFEKKVVI
jgi:FixH